MIYLLIVSLIWAFSFGLIRTHLAGLDANFVAWARMMLAPSKAIGTMGIRQDAKREALWIPSGPSRASSHATDRRIDNPWAAGQHKRHVPPGVTARGAS